jgi:hypothetical protein
MGFSLPGFALFGTFRQGRNHFLQPFMYQQAMDFSRGMGKKPRRRRNSMTSNPIPSILEERRGFFSVDLTPMN